PRLRRLARWGIHHPRYQRPGQPQAALAHQPVTALPRRHTLAAAVAGSRPRGGGRRGERRTLREGDVPHLRGRRARCRQSDTDLHVAYADRSRLLRAARFRPHNLLENRPGTFQSEEIIFVTYNNAGVRVFDIKDAFAPKEI